MKKTEEFLNRWKLKLMAVGVLIASLSLVVVLAGFRFYSRYREQVIRTEESQLLTMAGIVGNNLDSIWNSSWMRSICFIHSAGSPEEWAESNGDQAVDIIFLKKNADVYNWITVTEPDGTRFKYESGKEAVQESSAEKTMSVAPGNKDQKARITGKEICSDRTGWYELYIEKKVSSMSGICTLTFAMDLKALYEKIVAPVKIGEAGYSTVKDQNMNIIMHHAKNQIGLEAVEGASRNIRIWI